METVLVACMIDQLEAHRVIGFEVHRELGRPPRATVDVRLLGYADPALLLGMGSSLQFGHGEMEHRIKGVIASAASVATPSEGTGNQWTMRIEIVGQLGLLEHSMTSRIFQELTVPDIVKKVLADHGIADGAQEWKLGATYPPREYCVQYQETSLDFINRLLEQEGIFYSLRGTDDGEKIVFEDDSAGCEPLEGDATVPHVHASAQHAAGDAFHAIVETRRVMSGKVTLRDYDFKRPDLDLTAEAEADAEPELALFDFPGGYVEPAEGKRYAKVQLEAEQCQRKTLAVKGDVARLCEGRKLTLAHAPRSLDGEYVVTRVTHRYSALKSGSDPGARAVWLREAAAGARAQGGSDGAKLATEAELVPADVPFRRPATTPRPSIDGPQTATVVAPAGSEPEDIHTDEHGRVKVKFHWDLDEALDDKASCWMRTQQLQTSGSMILPRVDWEVVVEFQHGDPDRPIVTGRLYNGRYKPPYALPEGKTRSSIRSQSTPGGSGTNEIRFEDKAGSEEIAIRAEKNQTLATGNNKTKSTGANETQTVSADRTLKIGGHQTIKVTSGFKNTVTGAQTQSVKANRKVGINAVLGLSAPSMTGSVGGNQFEMDGNPIAGLIDLAAEKATEAAQAKAKEQMKKLDAAVKDKVDAIMGPIDKITDTLGKAQKGMEAAKNGDLSGMADAASALTGVPTPDKVMSDMKDAAIGKAKDAFNKVPGSQFAKLGAEESGLTGGDEKEAKKEGGGEEGGEKKEGGEEGGEKKEGGGIQGKDPIADMKAIQKDGFSKASGLDKMVDKGIENAINGAAGGLKDALGVGNSGKNFPGPEGGVSGNAEADNKCGPGHSIHKVTSTYNENIGSIRASIAVDTINTNIGGNRTQKIGAARIELINGTRAEACESKIEKAIGLAVVLSGNETESVAGDKSTTVGGAILAKVGGSCKVAAEGPAAFAASLIKVTASGKISFNCGESSVVIAGGGITIKSPTVNIAGGSVKLTKSVDEGPGGGTGGGAGAGAGDASGGADGEGSGAQGGEGGGGGGGAGTGGVGQQGEGKGQRGAGAKQDDDHGRKPVGGRKGNPEPSSDTKKLAAEPNKNPDDGKNADRKRARTEVVDHYYDNHHKAYLVEKDGKGGIKHTEIPVEDRHKSGGRSSFDRDQPVQYTPPGEKAKGAPWNGGPRVDGSMSNTGGGGPYPNSDSAHNPDDQKKAMDKHAEDRKAAGKPIAGDD